MRNAVAAMPAWRDAVRAKACAKHPHIMGVPSSAVQLQGEEPEGEQQQQQLVGCGTSTLTRTVGTLEPTHGAGIAGPLVIPGCEQPLSDGGCSTSGSGLEEGGDKESSVSWSMSGREDSPPPRLVLQRASAQLNLASPPTNLVAQPPSAKEHQLSGALFNTKRSPKVCCRRLAL